jgi:putative ABC transport system permease protein
MNFTRYKDGHWGVAIDPVLARRLEIGIGDSVFIGSLETKVRALVLKQPDRSLNANWRSTPVLLSS